MKSMYSVGCVSGSVDHQSREKTMSYKSRRVSARETLRKSWRFSDLQHYTVQKSRLSEGR